MESEVLKMEVRPDVKNPCLIMGFSGWMDGGDVSTGVIEYLTTKLGARAFAVIDPDPFYLLNVPGPMEIAALFRPHARIENGEVKMCHAPASTFFCDEGSNVILFDGKEPNLCWRRYAECILSLAKDLGVSMICFVGSVAGLVPHTRDPRIFGSVSDESLLGILDRNEVMPSNYAGPGSFVTYFTSLCKDRGLRMVSLVAEVPAYVEGKNLRCMAAVIQKLSQILGLSIDIQDLTTMSHAFIERLNETVAQRPDLAQQIRKIEQGYDHEKPHDHDEGLRDWFEKQGFEFGGRS
ncbi:MAG TPA: PAC2 family protein [Candidatus Hydrogenedentes bacterium]|nr:PAC2 family protein [Candidatus Hydrogenedentota bacterium]HPG67634.1 PAC2 family protein [Candidatus Hydrogenedentota bacterium]